MFAGLAGLIIGAIAGFAAKHRSLLSPVLPAALGGIVALVVWELLTWASALPGLAWLAYDQGWIWWITLIVTALVSFWVAIGLSSRRATRDADLLDRLSHVGRIKTPRRRSAAGSGGGASAATSTASDADRADSSSDEVSETEVDAEDGVGPDDDIIEIDETDEVDEVDPEDAGLGVDEVEIDVDADASESSANRR